jgi:hypothetical protein
LDSATFTSFATLGAVGSFGAFATFAAFAAFAAFAPAATGCELLVIFRGLRYLQGVVLTLEVREENLGQVVEQTGE